jgi:hypothetical protein
MQPLTPTHRTEAGKAMFGLPCRHTARPNQVRTGSPALAGGHI